MAGAAHDIGMGQEGFVARHGLHTDEQIEAVSRVESLLDEHAIRSVRIVVADQHGIPRTKWLTTKAFRSALRNGADFSGAIYSLDTSNAVFTPAFAEGGGFDIPEFTGFPDMVVVPDPTTFTVLPWHDSSAWVVCDPYFSNGQPVPLDARHLLRRHVAAAAELGYEFLSGLEIEFYVLVRDSATMALADTGMPAKAPAVTALEPGYQFLSEYRQASMEPVLVAIRDALLGAGLPLRTIENEWGPGQVEISFEPLTGLGSADAMLLFRALVKQVAHRMGLVATFMCWPKFPNFFPSGWHLHQSLLDRSGDNVFAAADAPLSDIGDAYAAGLLEHAQAMTLLGTPTLNGLRRFRPYSFAPDRVTWGLENRGVLVRVQGAPGDAGSHLEYRIGEPAANPYLYSAAALACGLDGVRRGLKPPPQVGVEDPYTVEAPTLPTRLEDAVAALEGSDFAAEALGAGMVRYLAMMKRAELGRFTEAVGDVGDEITDWEMDEYFETY